MEMTCLCCLHGWYFNRYVPVSNHSARWQEGTYPDMHCLCCSECISCHGLSSIQDVQEAINPIRVAQYVLLMQGDHANSVRTPDKPNLKWPSRRQCVKKHSFIHSLIHPLIHSFFFHFQTHKFQEVAWSVGPIVHIWNMLPVQFTSMQPRLEDAPN